MSPEVTLCHKNQTIKMAFDGPGYGFVNFTRKSLGPESPDANVTSFPVGTRVECRTYLDVIDDKIIAQKDCVLNPGDDRPAAESAVDKRLWKSEFHRYVRQSGLLISP